MAITISGENNNDRILASDGVIDQISGINFSGIITASHIDVGSNIQLGNAGIITATTFVGNVTGNVNSTSPLLLQTGGSERFRITGNNELGIAGANYGSSGQVLTSGGSGSAVSWTTPAVQISIVNYGDNKLVTATGNATSLNSEANLTFDGSNLNVTGGFNVTSDISMADTIKHTEDTDTKIRFPAADQIQLETAGSTRLHIHSDGRFRVGCTAQPSGTVGGFQLDMGSYPGTARLSSGAGASGTQTASFSIYGSNHHANLHNGANSGASLGLFNYNTTDGNSTAVSYHNSNSLAIARILGVNISHSSRNGALVFMTSTANYPTEKMRIDHNGRVLIGDGSTYNPQGLLHIVGDNNSNGPELYLQVNNNNTTDNIGALIFGNNVDKSVVKIQGVTHTANNTGDLTFHTSTAGTMSEKVRITSGGALRIGNLETGGNTTHSSETKLYIDSTRHYKIARRAAPYINNNGVGWYNAARIGAFGAAYKCFISLGGDFKADIVNVEILASSYNATLNNTLAGPIMRVTKTNVHNYNRISKVRIAKDSSNAFFIQFYLDGGYNQYSWGKSTLETEMGTYSQGNADSANYPMFEKISGTYTNIKELDINVRDTIVHTGTVSKPDNFYLVARRSGNQTGYNASNMSDNIVWNLFAEGSPGASAYLNTSNGLFTAPYTGLYHFHVAVNCSYNVQGAWLNINGSRPNYSSFYPNGTQSADASIQYKLTKGDTVGTKWYYNGITNGTINANALHTWWRIVLL